MSAGRCFIVLVCRSSPAACATRSVAMHEGTGARSSSHCWACTREQKIWTLLGMHSYHKIGAYRIRQLARIESYKKLSNHKIGAYQMPVYKSFRILKLVQKLSNLYSRVSMLSISIHSPRGAPPVRCVEPLQRRPPLPPMRHLHFRHAYPRT